MAHAFHAVRRPGSHAPATSLFRLGPLHFFVLMVWLLLFAMLYLAMEFAVRA